MSELPSPAPLFLLAFDHRRSIRGLFGITGEPSPLEIKRIVAAKKLILSGLMNAGKALNGIGVPGLLVDEELGAAVLESARSAGITAAVAVERSGQAEFQFEYGDDFGAHIDRFDPEYVKALVRFNPEGDGEMNDRQISRLRILSTWLREHHRKLLFELLVPPEPAQLSRLDGDPLRFDAELRPELVCRAVEQIQDAGIEVPVWKIEGIEDRTGCERVAATCRRDGRDDVQCLILGRGADQGKVEHWLRVAAPVAGFGGFAVGRTIWWDTIASHLNGEISRDEAVEAIGDRYLHFVDVYRAAAAAGSVV